jgi:hypothetical protein
MKTVYLIELYSESLYLEDWALGRSDCFDMTWFYFCGLHTNSFNLGLF